VEKNLKIENVILNPKNHQRKMFLKLNFVSLLMVNVLMDITLTLVLLLEKRENYLMDGEEISLQIPD